MVDVLLDRERAFKFRHPSAMFMSVWYAKNVGCRFLNNVRKAKRHRHHTMVGLFKTRSLGLFLVCFTLNILGSLIQNDNFALQLRAGGARMFKYVVISIMLPRRCFVCLQ